jgi:hypothetical protein
MPAIGSEQCRDPAIAVAAITAGQPDDVPGQGIFIRPAMGPLALGRPVLADHGTGPTFRYLQLVLKVLNAGPAAGGAQ